MATGSRFDTLLNQVQSRLGSLENTKDEFEQMTLDQKRQTIQRSKREIDQIQNNITEMERLIQTMPMRDRQFFTKDLLTFRDSHREMIGIFANFENEVQRLTLLEKAKKEESLNREQLERDNQRLSGLNSNLSKATELASDTLATQDNTMSVLAEDREILGHIDNNLDIIDEEADTGLAHASKLLRNACFNGFLTWTIVVLLIILDGYLLYRRINK